MVPSPWFRAAVLAGLSLIAAAGRADPLPKIGHVFIIVLENESYANTFGASSEAPYLAKELPKQGALLAQYYGIGHNSLDNYIAMISGQGPNPATQEDCQSFVEFRSRGMSKDGQAIGSGCVYPPEVPTVANQLLAAGKSWKGYMEDMGKDPARDAETCAHPAIGDKDGTQSAEPDDQYATRHDPFVYFHSIIDTPECAARVVPLEPALDDDLKDAARTPALAFITPNLCHDGHDHIVFDEGNPRDQRCVDGTPGGLQAVNTFLPTVVDRVLQSAAYKADGLLVVTFDEADYNYRFPKLQTEACCDDPSPGPNIHGGDKVFDSPDKGPGIGGPGGGRIGAVLLSPFIRPGTVSEKRYNHYSLLRTIEDLFALRPLGYAASAHAFGDEIFTRR